MALPGSVFPEDKLPQCWSDDVRMNALFAPFRLKSSNPESWDMKMKFWSDMLRLWCKYKKDPILCSADAKFAFQRKGRTCACLDIVIEEMFRSGELSPLSKYQQILHNGPEGWVRWGARLAFKPAAFALTAVTSLLPAKQLLDNDGLPKASIETTQRFVLESAVKDQATELLYNFPPGVERIGTIDQLMKVSGFQQGRETFEVLLGYLVSQGSAVKEDDVVKLAEPNKKTTPVSETDKALVKLMSSEVRLSCDAARLSRDVAMAESDAKAALQLGNRLAAKNHLRRKHKAQQRLTQCESALDNVKQLLQQMREVDVNAAIVDTYKTSSQAMKRGMEESGLDEDAVHDTMDSLKEVLESYSEVEKALGTTIDDYDAEELEQELKELLNQPGPPGGGTPAKSEKTARKEPKKISERDFVFDGEERILAELDKLDVDASSPGREKREKIAVADSFVEKPKESSNRPTKSWYLPADKVGDAWSSELRQDDRLHPGQPADVDYTSPPRLYSNDFQVRDHKIDNGVWYFNKREDGALASSTEYFSAESPGKTGGSFQMAPGGEREKQPVWHGEEEGIDELERRLKNLRGFHL
ncbi:charged multivesicular body protein 7 [Plodia interpunctella]|uniref:charged multivesicular body protein 7 n=1 Tax=Plodia interpunctella TaxID=58824 RepID=UPI0023677141|nr:charged multivesicular body protein 7 [Plodia interpunctella]